MEEHKSPASSSTKQWFDEVEPTSLDQLPQTEIVRLISKFAAAQHVSDILLYGPPSIKTTLVKLYLNEILQDPYHQLLTVMTGSEEELKQVAQFMHTPIHGKDTPSNDASADARPTKRLDVRVVLIDNLFKIPVDAMWHMRGRMDVGSKYCRTYFIATCETTRGLDEGMVSRFDAWYMPQLSKDELCDVLQRADSFMGIHPPPETLKFIAQHAHGGPRHAITLLQDVQNEPTVDAVKRVLHIPTQDELDTICAFFHDRTRGPVKVYTDFVEAHLREHGTSLIELVRAFVDHDNVFLAQSMCSLFQDMEDVCVGNLEDHFIARFAVDMVSFPIE